MLMFHLQILHCYENGVGNAKQDVQQLCLEREVQYVGYLIDRRQ